MDKAKWEQIIPSLVMIIAASLVTALLEPQVQFKQTLKNLCAGLLSGGIIMVLCVYNNLKGIWVHITEICFAAFITTLYPIVKGYIKKQAEKKSKTHDV